jgi:hypothetical protein
MVRQAEKRLWCYSCPPGTSTGLGVRKSIRYEMLDRAPSAVATNGLRFGGAISPPQDGVTKIEKSAVVREGFVEQSAGMAVFATNVRV